MINLRTRIRRAVSVEDRGYVTPCWIWKLSVDSKGYAQIQTGSVKDGTRKLRRAHRVAYEIFRGPIPDGLPLDHLCRVRRCVRASHLEAVPGAVNTARGGNALKTHCPAGHEYTADNIYWAKRPGGRRSRQCRKCVRAQQARRRAA